MKKLFLTLLIGLLAVSGLEARMVDFKCSVTNYRENKTYQGSGSIEYNTEDFSSQRFLRIEAKTEDTYNWYGGMVYFDGKYGTLNGVSDFTNNGKIKRRDTWAFFNEDQNEVLEVFTLLDNGKPDSLCVRKIVDGQPQWIIYIPYDKDMVKDVYSMFREAARQLELRKVKVG